MIISVVLDQECAQDFQTNLYVKLALIPARIVIHIAILISCSLDLS